MAKKNKRILTILGVAAGTGLAVYGIRQGLRWYQHRQQAYQPDTQLPEGFRPVEHSYQPASQPEREPIPATGPLAPAPPMTNLTAAERVNSDRIPDFDDRGTAFTASEMTSPGSGESTSQDRPAGDLYGSATGQQAGTERETSSLKTEIVMDDIVGPLIEHAIAFNSVMNLLRSRQRDGQGYEGTESLTSGDRSSMRAVLDQMQEHVENYDESVLRKNPLAQRSYALTRKLRDALDNINYTGSDLYRIQDEIKKDLCKLTRELDDSGQVTITGLGHIRQLYECQ